MRRVIWRIAGRYFAALARRAARQAGAADPVFEKARRARAEAAAAAYRSRAEKFFHKIKGADK